MSPAEAISKVKAVARLRPPKSFLRFGTLSLLFPALSDLSRYVASANRHALSIAQKKGGYEAPNPSSFLPGNP